MLGPKASSTDLFAQFRVFSYRKKPLFLCGCVVKTLKSCQDGLDTKFIKTHFLSLKVSAEIVMELTAEKDNRLLRLSDYKLSTKILERKVSKQEVILNLMVASVM